MSGCEWFPMSRAEIRAWVERHPETLPRTIGDLAPFPMPFRAVMLSMVTPDMRLRLWREHLESLSDGNAGLNEDQRAFVAATIPELPQIFAATAPNPVILDWEQRMSKVFTRHEAASVFKDIGPPEPPEGIALPSDALPVR